jgi:hypothetical protein
MKNLTLLNNQWKQKVAVELNEEEKALLRNFSEDKRLDRKSLSERVIAESLVTADSEDAGVAQALYDQNKIEGAELISVEVLLPSEIGIINCRLNGEHKQIRF